MDLSDARRMERARPVLAYSPHPMQSARDRQLVYAEFLPGETIAEYLKRAGIWARLPRHPLVCTINGRLVPRDLWTRCRPKPGTMINLYAVVRGGGKKNPITTILSIALLAAGQAWGAELGTFLGVSSEGLFGIKALSAQMVGSAVISVAGGLAINALFPAPRPSFSNAQGLSAAESPTYAISGAQNSMRPYQPMPKLLGTHKWVPDLGAKPYSEFQGEDQIFYLVFDYGHNPDAILGSHKFGANAVETVPGITLQESGADGALTLFPANVDTQEGGAMPVDGPFLLRTSSPDTTALAVEITGQLWGLDTDSGAVAGNFATIAIEYRAVGGGAWLPFTGASPFQFSNASRKPLRLTYRIDVAKGQYEVQVRMLARQAGEGTAENFTHELVWSQLRSYQPDTADYTGRKRIAVRVPASALSTGMLQQFSTIGRGRCQVWTGAAWVLAETSNPAWWYLDWARGKFVAGRRVWGAGLADARIDIEGIKSWALFCVAEGLTVDAVLDQQGSIQDMAAAIALCGRATISWASGKFGVVVDAADQPVVAVFGAQNIFPQSFEIEYATEPLADEIVGWFINPDLDWQRDSVRAAVPGATGTARVREIQIFGCTHKPMASHFTNLYAAANAYRARKYIWRTDFEGKVVDRGDVVQLPEDIATLDRSGRFKEGGNAGTLKLARKVPLYAGGAYITIVKPDATFSTHAAQGGTGDTDTLVLVAALGFNPWADPDGHPPYDYKFTYGQASLPGRKVKIEQIKPSDARTLQIVAIDERPEYYAAKDNPTAYVPPRPVFGGAQISNLALTEDGVRAGNGYLARVIVTWDTGPDFGWADVRASVDGGPMTSVATQVRSRGCDFNVSDGSDIVVEVTGFSSLGRLGQALTLTAARHVDFAGVSPPADVVTFALDGTTFRWSTVGNVDLLGYKIYFHYGENRSLADANELHQGLLTASPETFETLPSGRVTFMIVAHDAAHLESVTPAVIVKDLGDPDLANVVEETDFRALGWPGTVTGGAVDAGDLVADDGTDFYGPDAAPFYGADADPFYEASVYTTMVYETLGFSFPAKWIGSTMVLQHAIEGQVIRIEFRQGNQEPFYGDPDAPFYGPDDEPFYGAPLAWQPWPSAVTFEGGDYQLRITIEGSSVPGALRALDLVIDVPDVEEDIADVDVPPGGTRLALTHDYDAIKTIQLTLEDDGGAAVSAKWLDKDPDLGPLIVVLDSANVSVAGRVDARVKGR